MTKENTKINMLSVVAITESINLFLHLCPIVAYREDKNKSFSRGNC